MVSQVRRSGSYAALWANYYQDDAIMTVGVDAELLFLRSLAFCAGAFTDGQFTRRQATGAFGGGLTDIQTLIDALIDAGLWIPGPDPDTYVIRSWLKWNRSRDEITRMRNTDAARKRPAQSTSVRNPRGVRSESESDVVRNPHTTKRNVTRTTTPKGRGVVVPHEREVVPPTEEFIEARRRIAQAASRRRIANGGGA